MKLWKALWPRRSQLLVGQEFWSWLASGPFAAKSVCARLQMVSSTSGLEAKPHACKSDGGPGQTCKGQWRGPREDYESSRAPVAPGTQCWMAEGGHPPQRPSTSPRTAMQQRGHSHCLLLLGEASLPSKTCIFCCPYRLAEQGKVPASQDSLDKNIGSTSPRQSGALLNSGDGKALAQSLPMKVGVIVSRLRAWTMEASSPGLSPGSVTYQLCDLGHFPVTLFSRLY